MVSPPLAWGIRVFHDFSPVFVRIDLNRKVSQPFRGQAGDLRKGAFNVSRLRRLHERIRYVKLECSTSFEVKLPGQSCQVVDSLNWRETGSTC